VARLRYNNSLGLLGEPLTATGTTVTFDNPPEWDTITGSDYIPVVLDPPTNVPNPNFEVVYVTAYTEGDLTATIERGQEGTNPIEHADGAEWQVAPTVDDFLLENTSSSSLPPSRAYRNAALSITSGAWNKVPLDTISFDTNGYMDVTTNGRYNVPASGSYLVVANAALGAPSGQDAYVSVFKNGVEVSEASSPVPSGGAAVEPVLTDIIQCNAGDYLELYVYCNGNNLYLGGSEVNYLSVVPLSQQSIASQVAPVAARACRSADFSFSAGAWTKVPLDTLNFDTGSNMDVATNNRFDVPVSGYYQVEAAMLQTANTYGYVSIYKNGTQISQAGGSADTDRAETTDLIYCEAGDYLELWVYSGSGALNVDSGLGSTGTYLAVAQVSGVPGSNLAAARAYRANDLSLSSNNWNKVPLDTESFDPNGNIDVDTNGRYNVPAAGPYLVIGNVEANSGQVWAGIFKNGSGVAYGSVVPGSTVGVSTVIDIVNCNAGDFLELWIQPGDATSLQVGNGSGNNFLSVTPLVSTSAESSSSGGGSGSRTQNVQVDDSGSAYTISDPNVASWTLLTITADCPLTFPTPAVGKSFRLMTVNNGYSVTWPSNIQAPNGSPPTISRVGTDYYEMSCLDGVNWVIEILGQMIASKPAPTVGQTYVGGVTSTSLTGSFPSAPAEGDILVAFVSVHGVPGNSSNNGLTSAPAGWTQAWNVYQYDNTGLYCYYKTAGASESNSYTWGFQNSNGANVVMYDCINASAIDKSGGSTGPDSTPSATSNVDDPLLLVGLCQNFANNPTWSDPNLTTVAPGGAALLTGWRKLASSAIPAETASNPEGTGSRPMGFITVM
jgi:hypothetical protein